MKLYIKKEEEFIDLDLIAYGVPSRHRKVISVNIGHKYIEMTEGEWETIKRFIAILEGSENSMD
jgi:hypothetical protein